MLERDGNSRAAYVAPSQCLSIKKSIQFILQNKLKGSNYPLTNALTSWNHQKAIKDEIQFSSIPKLFAIGKSIHKKKRKTKTDDKEREIFEKTWHFNSMKFSSYKRNVCTHSIPLLSLLSKNIHSFALSLSSGIKMIFIRVHKSHKIFLIRFDGAREGLETFWFNDCVRNS